MTLPETVTYPPHWLPASPQFVNYPSAWTEAKFPRYLVNTISIASCTTAAMLVTSSLAAYAFAQLKFFGKNIVFVGLLATLMIPFEVTMIPDFLVVKQLGWYNTYWAQIIPWSASVFSIFLLRQFFTGLPKDLWEAAQLDGAGHMRYLLQVVVPLSTPAITTAGLFTFLGSWNSFVWPLIVTKEDSMRPIQVGLSYFVQEQGVAWHLLMAGATITVLPVIVVFVFVQRQFIEGIARSGLKG
ncbi:MAG: carbohydrate ABC transporter permease [Dehalococcoidia bacterium]